MPMLRSGVLGGILTATSRSDTTKSNSQNLRKGLSIFPKESSRENKDSEARNSPRQRRPPILSPIRVRTLPPDKETRLHKKIDLMMGLGQDMAPAAKTLQEAHDASLLYDDDGDVPADNVSDSGEQEVDEPPSKRCKSYLGTHRSIPEAGQSTADLNSRVDSLVTVMTENEVMGPATSGKIASVLNNILAGGLNE